MKKNNIKIISAVLALLMFSNVCFADCDFSKGITKTGNGYLYTPECNLAVGQLVQDNQTKDTQIADLTKAISLKDLAVKTSDDRTQLWMDTSLKLEKNINEIDSLKKDNEWIAFGLGALTVIGTGFALGAVTNRH